MPLLVLLPLWLVSPLVLLPLWLLPPLVLLPCPVAGVTAGAASPVAGVTAGAASPVAGAASPVCLISCLSVQAAEAGRSFWRREQNCSYERLQQGLKALFWMAQLWKLILGRGAVW